MFVCVRIMCLVETETGFLIRQNKEESLLLPPAHYLQRAS